MFFKPSVEWSSTIKIIRRVRKYTSIQKYDFVIIGKNAVVEKRVWISQGGTSGDQGWEIQECYCEYGCEMELWNLH